SGPRSLITLKANTGEIIWEGHRAQTASCSETMVFAVVPRSFVMAFDLSTGQSVWQGINPRHDVLGLIYNPEEEKLIAGGSVIVDPRSGQVLRSFEPPFLAYLPDDQGRGDMYLLDRGQLFFGGSVRDANTGQILHKEDRFGGYASPTVTEDTIYIADGGGYDYPSGVAAVDRDTYAVKWI
ncbi:MAG: PQQ-binding-like beta-propeller repeat protein, partial [Chloroflexi bacterium]|nr:PQQ-binding-like beta-propeller repeat protein [Chloroflexota bacterium]